MATNPLITFKAGRCELSGRKVKALPTPGYIYLYSGDDDLLHFCWRPRSSPATDAELDLIMFPQDGTFHPLVKEQGAEDLHSPTNGRIFALKFASSSQKHYFWMQSKSQAKDGSASFFSQRDQRLGQIVDGLLQGDITDVDAELEDLRRHGGEGGTDGDADAMEVEAGGAGQDAAGGNTRSEGRANREGGADGGRAPTQSANRAVQDFLASFNSNDIQQRLQQQQGRATADIVFTSLPDLLPPSTTISHITTTATEEEIDTLCTYLPQDILVLAYESADSSSSSTALPPNSPADLIKSLSPSSKKSLLSRVLRSPQFQQSLGSLTNALREGGLPMIGDALGLKIKNGGRISVGNSSPPLGGGEAVKAFVEGVKTTVAEKEAEATKKST